jgi:hypothetical protein
VQYLIQNQRISTAIFATKERPSEIKEDIGDSIAPILKMKDFRCHNQSISPLFANGDTNKNFSVSDNPQTMKHTIPIKKSLLRRLQQ